jgi:hypothetical protein
LVSRTFDCITSFVDQHCRGLPEQGDQAVKGVALSAEQDVEKAMIKRLALSAEKKT